MKENGTEFDGILVQSEGHKSAVVGVRGGVNMGK